MTEIVKEAPIEACAGETVALTAPRVGVGGYQWEVEIDPALGEVVSRKLAAASEMVGGGTETRFEIAVKSRRDGIVRLILRRPWEKTPAKILEYPLRCKG